MNRMESELSRLAKNEIVVELMHNMPSLQALERANNILQVAMCSPITAYDIYEMITPCDRNVLGGGGIEDPMERTRSAAVIAKICETKAVIEQWARVDT